VTTADLAGLLSGIGPDREDTFLTLHESAAWLGRIRYLELGVFERVGQRAASLRPAPVAGWAEAASLAAAWRASQIAELLPVSAGLPDAGALTRSAGAAIDEALDLLGPPPGHDLVEDPDGSGSASPGAAPDLVGPFLDGPALVDHVATSFYPSLLAAYEARRRVHSPAADGPVLRVLVRVVADLRAELMSASAIAETV
jgi:hypothetical protein